MAETADYDGAWKEALEIYWRPFLELCFPLAAADIDWTVPVEFLDKELQEIVRDAELGKQRVDKLVKMRRLDGAEERVLIHVEVQSQPDPELPLRVYQYHHRIVDRFGHRTATMVVLADEQPGWRPGRYEQELWGCRVVFEYPVCKLLDFKKDEDRLEDAANPAAVVVAAHLAALSTRNDMELRKKFKWQLTRRLYDRGYVRKDVLEIFRLIDWMLGLPDELEVEFRQELINFECENDMPYVTSIERLGREEGREEGRQEGRQEGLERGLQKGRQEDIIEALEIRFGSVPEGLAEAIRKARDEDRLRLLHRAAIQSASLGEFTKSL